MFSDGFHMFPHGFPMASDGFHMVFLCFLWFSYVFQCCPRLYWRGLAVDLARTSPWPSIDWIVTQRSMSILQDCLVSLVAERAVSQCLLQSLVLMVHKRCLRLVALMDPLTSDLHG